MVPENSDDPVRAILDEFRKTLDAEYSTEHVTQQLELIQIFLGAPRAASEPDNKFETLLV